MLPRKLEFAFIIFLDLDFDFDRDFLFLLDLFFLILETDVRIFLVELRLWSLIYLFKCSMFSFILRPLLFPLLTKLMELLKDLIDLGLYFRLFLESSALIILLEGKLLPIDLADKTEI